MKKSFLILAFLAVSPGLRAASPYDTYEAPVATPTPVPADTQWFAFHKPYWSLGLKGGGALPLGNLSTYNGTGPSAGLDLIYQGTRKLGTDFFALYSTQPYKLGGGASPLNNLALGLKLLYEVTQVEALNAWVGAGAAYVLTQRTQQVLRQPVTTPVQYDPTVQNTGGLGLLFCFGSSFLMTDHVALTMELNVINVALAGGTGDSVLLGLPQAGLRYDF
jgi:hypothetical protein